MKLAELKGFTPDQGIKILENQELKEYTTFRVGGPADLFAEPKDPEELRDLLVLCRQNSLPYYILGHGSNILFTDKGYRGMIIFLGENFGYIEQMGNDLRVGAGALLKDVTDFALERELEGIVFACGIPGSLGGAIYMNAGAYGGEMKEVVHQVKVMDRNGSIKYYTGEEMEFGYRTSRIQDTGEIILEATLRLRPGKIMEMKERTADLTQKREEKQPLDMASAGSTFKRPEGYFAGKLIMDAGLSGYACGDAAVSTKHCGFVINKGSATFADIMALVEHIQRTVEEKFGVKMQPEIRIVGER